jgi:hypothetical protein
VLISALAISILTILRQKLTQRLASDLDEVIYRRIRIIIIHQN